MGFNFMGKADFKKASRFAQSQLTATTSIQISSIPKMIWLAMKKAMAREERGPMMSTVACASLPKLASSYSVSPSELGTGERKTSSESLFHILFPEMGPIRISGNFRVTK